MCTSKIFCKMPVESLCEWSVSRLGDSISIEAWMSSILPIGSTGINNSGIGKQGQRKGSNGIRVFTFHQHLWNVPVKTIRRAQQGCPDGWTVSISGKTLILGFQNRKQNPKYPIQTLEEIQAILGC